MALLHIFHRRSSKRRHRLLLLLITSLICVFLYMKSSQAEVWISPPALDDVREVKDNGEALSQTLVVASRRGDNLNWITQRLPQIPAAIYIADDPQANLTVPKNKGNEAMVYLTYIIDNYDALPDVSIFIHGHAIAWHDDSPLLHGMADVIARLNRKRVLREGYVNLRCDWDPGCPKGKSLVENHGKPLSPEEHALRQMWTEVHHGAAVPISIAQTCCAQFATSRERIRAVPLSQWQLYRTWLLETSMSDYLSGRAFEHSWAYILTGSVSFCPAMNVCYCDGFGLCFGSTASFQSWWELRKESHDLRDQYIEVKSDPEGEDLDLKQRLADVENKVKVQAAQALERGLDPRNRLAEAG